MKWAIWFDDPYDHTVLECSEEDLPQAVVPKVLEWGFDDGDEIRVSACSQERMETRPQKGSFSLEDGYTDWDAFEAAAYRWVAALAAEGYKSIRLRIHREPTAEILEVT